MTGTATINPHKLTIFITDEDEVIEESKLVELGYSKDPVLDHWARPGSWADQILLFKVTSSAVDGPRKPRTFKTAIFTVTGDSISSIKT